MFVNDGTATKICHPTVKNVAWSGNQTAINILTSSGFVEGGEAAGLVGKQHPCHGNLCEQASALPPSTISSDYQPIVASRQITILVEINCEPGRIAL